MRTQIVLGVITALLLSVAYNVNATDVPLSWTAPTANTDSTPISKIGGYNIYRASTPNIQSQAAGGKAPLAGGPGNGVTATSYVDKNVSPGTYYYAVSAWACEPACIEGPLSTVVSVTIPVPPPTTKTPNAPTNFSASCNVSGAGACTVTVAGK